MAEIQVPGAPAINGVNGHAATNGTGASSPANDAKKLMMLDWAWQNREKFIKLMVLSTWSRRAAEVVKMVDLNMFLNEQMHVYGIAADAVGNLKLALQPFKAPNPDLKMALEVLSTGKAPWMPSLDYIPKEPLTPQQMLSTLRNVNTMLSIRINLHEDLPKHLKNYTIANGRATFVIPGEFELAVSIADEEPTSPFFVVDVKFLFTPTPQVPDEFFRLEVEPMANHYLANGGLSGCYDWLHNFVLTHKVATLRAQAIELSQEAWSGATQVHQFNRTLSVQYWSERPGPKSWVEIGISTGKPKKGWSWRGPEPSRIVLNWKRNGVLVEDVKVNMDLTDLSMERILMAVIALHTTHVLETIRDRLAISAYASSGLSIHLDTSKQEPADCSLRVDLVGSQEPTEVRIEPVSGSLTLSPANVLSSRLEQDINRAKDMTSVAAQRIEYQMCMHLKSYIDRQAANTGWTTLRNLNLNRNTIYAATHRKIVSTSFYRGQGWKGNWVMAVTINLDGESWWLMELWDTP
ncbi:MED14-domain-containing protein, partial [Saccharata proteae CBS 121410]